MKELNSDYAATLQFISSLSWPALLFWLLWRFRTQVEQLLARLATIKVAGSEFVFQAPSEKAVTATPTAKAAILELPPDTFVPVSGIRKIVEQSQLLHPDETVTSHLLLFQTPAQHTWLVATNTQVFVVLDDNEARRSARLIQSVLPRDKILPLKTQADGGFGVVRFSGERTWWYYSRDLFPNPKSLSDSISNLLLNSRSIPGSGAPD